jgi:hypothetical protein
MRVSLKKYVMLKRQAHTRRKLVMVTKKSLRIYDIIGHYAGGT